MYKKSIEEEEEREEREEREREKCPTRTRKRSSRSESNSVKSVHHTRRGGLFPHRVFRVRVCACASDKLSRLLRRRRRHAAVGRRVWVCVCEFSHKTQNASFNGHIYMYVCI